MLFNKHNNAVAAGDGQLVPSARARFTAIAISAFASFGGILYGYDTGTISGIIAMEDWLKTFGHNGVLSTSHKSLVVSILSAGTFFGALLGGPASDRLGRKGSFYLGCMLFVLGVGLQLDTKLATFVVGRVFAGLGVGVVSMTVPLYQSECSPKQLRGLIVGLYQWAITIGILLAAIVNNAQKNIKNHSSWRVVIAIQFVWAAILVVGMLILPESPRYYVKKGRPEDAKRSISKLLGVPIDSPAVEIEYQNIYDNLQHELAVGNNSYMELFRVNEGKFLLRTLTGTGIQAMQQLTGINFIFYYGTTFFQASGIKNPFTITIATNVVNVGATIPGILAIDRVGRRKLLIWGAIVMCICEYIVAIVGVTVGGTDANGNAINLSAQKVLIAFVCIYIAAFASTWGPGAYIVCSEIFPLAVRSKGISLSVASNWLWNFGIGYATPYLVDPSTSAQRTAHLGVKVFFIWGSTCLFCILFAYLFVPETKGLSLEQVDDMYRNSTIRSSGKYRRQILSNEEALGGEFHRDADKKPAGDVTIGNVEHHDAV